MSDADRTDVSRTNAPQAGKPGARGPRDRIGLLTVCGTVLLALAGSLTADPNADFAQLMTVVFGLPVALVSCYAVAAVVYTAGGWDSSNVWRPVATFVASGAAWWVGLLPAIVAGRFTTGGVGPVGAAFLFLLLACAVPPAGIVVAGFVTGPVAVVAWSAVRSIRTRQPGLFFGVGLFASVPVLFLTSLSFTMFSVGDRPGHYSSRGDGIGRFGRLVGIHNGAPVLHPTLLTTARVLTAALAVVLVMIVIGFLITGRRPTLPAKKPAAPPA